MYVSAPAGKLDKPYQELASFIKTPVIEPGESVRVETSFDMRDMASFDSALSAYVLEKGSYVVRAGNSSVDTNAAAIINLNEDVVVRKVRHMTGCENIEDWKPTATREFEIPEGLPVLNLPKADIECENVDYDISENICEEVKDFSDEELIYASIGAFDPKGGITGIIGNASTKVAGAAGESCGRLKDKGLPAVVMADGPAGLRLSPEYYRDKEGKAYSLGSIGMPESMGDLLPAPLKLVMKLMNRKKEAA